MDVEYSRTRAARLLREPGVGSGQPALLAASGGGHNWGGLLHSMDVLGDDLRDGNVGVLGHKQLLLGDGIDRLRYVFLRK